MTTNNPMDDAAFHPDAEPQYENEHYRVYIYNGEGEKVFKDDNFDYDECYVVINRSNKMIEHACTRLPEACFVAHNLNKAMLDPPWGWAEKVVDAASEDNTTTPPPSVN